jgi:AcrR family transcriptional regulator
MSALAAKSTNDNYDDETSGMKKGRPRSDASKRAILEATRRLLSHTTVQKLSIEAIAKKAGVGKTTIYRWWPSKAAVTMDAIFSQPGFQNILPTPSSAEEGIYTQLEKMVAQMNGKYGRIIAQIVSEIQDDHEAVESFHRHYLMERCFNLAKLVDQGIKSGEFREDIDIETTVDALVGPLIFRLMCGLVMGEEYARKVVDTVIPAIKA